MQATGFVRIAHGLTLAKIRTVHATIISDSGNSWYSLQHSDTYTDLEGKLNWDATDIVLFVRVGGYFNGLLFNDAVMNRGYVTIGYVQ